MNTYREYVGNPHIHSIYSGSPATHRQIVEAAIEAGLNFVIVTDHNVFAQDIEAYHGQLLLLSGEEVYNARRIPPCNHLLAYDITRELAPFAFSSSSALLKTLRERGGFGYIAHPVQRTSLIGPGSRIAPWVDWPMAGVTGIELWNSTAELRQRAWSPVTASIYRQWPGWALTGPNRGALRLWDELLGQGQRLAALGGASAHNISYRGKAAGLAPLSYSTLLRCVNTHVLTLGPITGELARDRALIYEALRAGRTWVGYDLPHTTRGFRFLAQSGAARATCGEELKRLGAIDIAIDLPARGDIRLLHNGKCIQTARGYQLHHISVEPGIYRVEVYRRYLGRRVGWIYSSPIYVV